MCEKGIVIFSQFDYDVIEKRGENSKQFYYRLIREQHPYFSTTRYSTITLQNCETIPTGRYLERTNPLNSAPSAKLFQASFYPSFRFNKSRRFRDPLNINIGTSFLATLGEKELRESKDSQVH